MEAIFNLMFAVCYFLWLNCCSFSIVISFFSVKVVAVMFFVYLIPTVGIILKNVKTSCNVASSSIVKIKQLRL